MDKTRKKIKQETITSKLDLPIDSRIIIELADPYGQGLNQSLDLPISATKDQLQATLNELLRAEEPVVYSFFHGTIELTDNLQQLITKIGSFNAEKSLPITFYPQQLYRIKPLTRQTAALEGHTQPVLAVQFRNQGDLVATASGDTTIIIWDTETETPHSTLKGGHNNWVLCISWCPTGNYLISGGMEGFVCVWDCQTFKLIGQPLKGHTKWITSLAWEPMHLEGECRLFASSSKDGTIRIWSRVTMQCLISISAHQKSITKMLWGGEGYLYSASEDTTICVWNKNGQKIQTLKGHGHWVNSIALNTDFTLRRGCFSEDNKEKNVPLNLVDEMTKSAKKIWDKIVNGQKERLVSGSDDQTLCLWNHGTAKPLKRMAGHQQPVNHVQFSPDGRFIVSASFDKSLRVWDGYTGDAICVLRGHVGPVYQVSWSSDSRMMLSGSKDSTLKLWSLQKQKLLFDLPGHADEVYGVDWAPVGGEKAVSGGKDKMVKIWRH